MENTVNTIQYRPQTVVINDKKELYRCYMPFVKGGGLFIPFNEEITPNKIAPGQKILVVLTILENRDKTPISGKVVWISRGGVHKGFGISFGDGTNNSAMKSLKDHIEASISEFTLKKEPTYTL